MELVFSRLASCGSAWSDPTLRENSARHWEIAVTNNVLNMTSFRNEISAMLFAGLMTSVVGVTQASELRHPGAAPAEQASEQGPHSRPSGKGFGVPDPSGRTEHQAKQAGRTTSSNGIFYHGQRIHATGY